MKVLYIVFVLSVSLLQAEVQAQAEKDADETRVKLNHIAIYVNDLEKSTIFYEEVLGLTQIPEPFDDGRHTWFTIGAAGQLHLIKGAKEGIDHDKNSHLCFSVKSIDEFVRNLDNYEIDRENWVGDSKDPNVRVDGVKQIYFQDPDGYWLEVNDDFR